MLTAIPSSIVEPLSVLFLSFVILYYVGYREKTVAEVMILLLFFYKAFSRVFSFQTEWQKFNASLGGLETVSDAERVFRENLERSGGRKITDFTDAIRLDSIDFSYGNRQVLFNINIEIPKNRIIGIVGESGAGKTTLFDIITGLLVPQSGYVTIDGVDYRDLDFSTLHRMIGYVTQDPVIFNDTVANNISFWECKKGDTICMKRIQKAARLANCDDFIREMDDGYMTVIGDKGIKLSGGQRQRIAIARELFKNPQIMIFDEATSSLDTKSEMLIQKSIESMKGTKTMVIIAHRLSTIKNCDYIYVLSRGRVMEEGTFNDLYEDKGSRFYRMCQAQNL
jgi:subfamily B ATP-binding cassette protein MsbA